MPEVLKRCVSKVKAQGKDEQSAYAICSTSTGWKKAGKHSWRKGKKMYKEMVSADAFGAGSAGHGPTVPGGADTYAPGDARMPKILGGVQTRHGLIGQNKKRKRPSFKRAFESVLRESYASPSPVIPDHTICSVVVKSQNLEQLTEDLITLSGITYNKERKSNGNLVITFEARSPYIDNFSNRMNGMFGDRLNKEIFVRLEKAKPLEFPLPKNRAGELAVGKKVEREHTATVDKIKKGTLKPVVKDVAASIAGDHLREKPKYYTKLLKARL
jgi:hypothetical protein